MSPEQITQQIVAAVHRLEPLAGVVLVQAPVPSMARFWGDVASCSANDLARAVPIVAADLAAEVGRVRSAKPLDLDLEVWATESPSAVLLLEPPTWGNGRLEIRAAVILGEPRAVNAGGGMELGR